MISRRLLLSAAFVLSAAPALAQGPDPAAIVRSIYQQADRYGAAAALQMRAESRDKVLSKSLADLWKRSDDATPDGDEAPPGFDVASNSNAMEVGKADVTVERRDAARVTVVARLTSAQPFIRKSPQDNIVRYDFVRQNGRWKIDNIRSTIDGKPWTIRELLTEGLAANERRKTETK